jgi:hypothetical protein
MNSKILNPFKCIADFLMYSFWMQSFCISVGFIGLLWNLLTLIIAKHPFTNVILCFLHLSLIIVGLLHAILISVMALWNRPVQGSSVSLPYVGAQN